MKKALFSFIAILIISVSSYAQETTQNGDSLSILAAAEKEKQLVIAKIEKAEKEAKRAQKAEEKMEKEQKRAEKLKKEIRSREKSIDKDEKNAIKLQNKIEKGKIKGTLAPVDIQKMEEKILDLNAKILKNKGKLDKLKRKQ
jgi:peptidoglycan hydrolase CwlO-like protein